jgi:hypothetical protein
LQCAPDVARTLPEVIPERCVIDNANVGRLIRLLRARPERRCDHCATDKADKLAPLHSTPSLQQKRLLCRSIRSVRIYSDGTVLTTDRVSSVGLHPGSLGGSLTALRSLGLLTTGWSTWARVACAGFADPVMLRSMRG